MKSWLRQLETGPVANQPRSLENCRRKGERIVVVVVVVAVAVAAAAAAAAVVVAAAAVVVDDDDDDDDDGHDDCYGVALLVREMYMMYCSSLDHVDSIKKMRSHMHALRTFNTYGLYVNICAYIFVYTYMVLLVF